MKGLDARQEYFNDKEVVLFHKGSLFTLLETLIMFAHVQFGMNADDCRKMVSAMFAKGRTPHTVYEEFLEYLERVSAKE